MLSYKDNKKWVCSACGLTLYNNVAAAVALILTFQKQGKEQVLLVTRGRNPRKGYLALPGGFVDPGESAEQAAIRECREEVSLIPQNLHYLTSAPNTYEYKDITYITCDMFFSANVDVGKSDFISSLRPEEADEIKGYRLCPIDTFEAIEAIPLAFPSARIALETYFRQRMVVAQK